MRFVIFDTANEYLGSVLMLFRIKRGDLAEECKEQLGNALTPIFFPSGKEQQTKFAVLPAISVLLRDVKQTGTENLGFPARRGDIVTGATTLVEFTVCRVVHSAGTLSFDGHANIGITGGVA